MTDKPLTPQQEAFATNLASGMTQAQAYRQAYPKSQKWKDKSVHERASHLAANVKVQSRVAELSTKAAAANNVTIERIVAELAKVAFGNAKTVMRWTAGGMSLIPSDELDDDQAAIVSEVKQTVSQSGGSMGLKTHDKVKALQLLGEHLAMFTKKSELTGPGGQPLVPQASGVLVVPAAMSEDDWVKAAQELHARQQVEKGGA